MGQWTEIHLSLTILKPNICDLTHSNVKFKTNHMRSNSFPS